MHPSEPAIHDYVDDVLDARQRTDVERHLEGCSDCRRLVDDLREIRKMAAVLKNDLRDPPVRAWARLERAIKLEHSQGPAKGRRDTRTRVWLAAAAVLLVATVVGLQFRARQRTIGNRVDSSTSTPPNSSATNQAAQAVEAELRAAEEHYTKAITGLEQIAKTEQGALDPATAATLQKNLAVIDLAIGESRAALRSQPTNEPAQESLVENFKAKIGLLQDTVALINEMRKGNEAGAARIVSGLKPKGD
jgi:anti-sigma factor RsiW